MRRNRVDDAIKILHLSTLIDLENTNGISYGCTLIGECCLKSGRKEMALMYYAKALELDKTNKTAKEMLQELTSPKNK